MGNPFRIHLPLSTIASGTVQPFPPSVWKGGACGSLGVARLDTIFASALRIREAKRPRFAPPRRPTNRDGSPTF